MQIHGYNDHYQEHQKNLFLGEGYRVFANGNPDGQSGGAQDPDSQQQREQNDPWETEYITPSSEELLTKEDDERVKDFRELVPGKTKYAPGNEARQMKLDWNEMWNEHTIVQGSIDYYTKLVDHLQNNKRWDPSSPKWRSRLGKVYASYEKLKADLPDLDNIERSQASDIQEQRNLFIQDVQKMITSLTVVRTLNLETIETQIKEDFQARTDWLIDQWKNHPPKGYEDEKYSSSQMHFLSEVAEKIQKDLPALLSKDELKEYKAVWADLDRLEDKYLFAKEPKRAESQFSQEQLELEFSEIEKKANALLNSTNSDGINFVSKYEEEVDQTAATLEQLIKDIQDKVPYSNEKEKLDKEKHIEALQKQLTNLKKSRNANNMLLSTLDCNDPIMLTDENGNETGSATFTIGNEIRPYPKGLKQQLQLLKELPFNEDERREFALGMHDAMEMFNKDIQNLSDRSEFILPAEREKLQHQIDTINRPEGGGSGYKITWLAMYDINRSFEIIKEWSARRYKRASTQRVGKFGSSILKPLASKYNPISPLRTLPNEFDKEVEKSEQDEVNQYMEIYSNKDMWQVEEIAYNTKNQDEFKACLILLSENGRLRWDRPGLLKQFNYFQSYIRFQPNNIMLHLQDISGFYDDLRRTCGYIWDFDTFNELKNKNSSAYDSKKSEYEQLCHQWAEQEEGAFGKILGGWVESYKEKGEAAKVDPILYEKVIDYAITYGKAGPEEKLYFLIQGIATGLLPHDRGSVLNSLKINDYPVIDYFGSATERGGKPTMKDLQEVAQLDEVAFVDWFHRKAMTLDRVTQRVDKTLTQGNKLDHDDLTPFLGYMGGQTTETMLKAHADGFRLPQTGVQNATIGMLFFINNLAHNFDDMKNSQEQLKRFVGSFTRFDGITSSRMYKKEHSQYFRLDSTAYDEKPRSQNNYDDIYFYGQKEQNTRKNIEKLREYISIIDPEFFGALYNRSLTDGQVPDLVARMKQKYSPDVFGELNPTNVDELHMAAGELVGWLIAHPQGRENKITAMITAIRADQEKVFAKMRADGKKTIMDRRAAGETKAETLRSTNQLGNLPMSKV